jgi:peroxiredoxin
VTFVAISPELPDVSLSTKEKHELEFTVLSDLGNRYAHELGIVYQQPEELRPVFKQIGNDLEARNGDDSFAVPIPTTILVDKEGVVRNAHLDADYFKRLDPEVTLGWIDAL